MGAFLDRMKKELDGYTHKKHEHNFKVGQPIKTAMDEHGKTWRHGVVHAIKPQKNDNDVIHMKAKVRGEDGKTRTLDHYLDSTQVHPSDNTKTEEVDASYTTSSELIQATSQFLSRKTRS